MSIQSSMLSQPSSHLPRRNAILLELLFSIFAYGSRTPAVYEQQICPANTSFSSSDALQPICCEHYCCVPVPCLAAITTSTGVYTAPSPVHGLDFLILFLFCDCVPFLCDQDSFWNDISREKYVDSSLDAPALSYSYPTAILRSERTQEHPFPETQPHLHILRTMINHSRFTHLRTIIP